MKTESSKPFEGKKIIDLCWSGVGVFVLNFLGYYGGTIVRVESSIRPDPVRASPPFAPTYGKDEHPGLERSAYFSLTHTVKEYGMALNLNNPKAIEVFKKLVAWADIVCESFTGGQMEKWGLGYDDLKKIKADIIMFRTCGYGHTGPLAGQPGFGQTLSSVAGLNSITGWPDRPSIPIVPYYSDLLSPLFGAVALLAAVDYQYRTGLGQCIDHSQVEASVNYLTPIILDYVVNGREFAPTGNRLAYAAPHGVYSCKGNDRWVAIAVFTDAEWENFCKVIGGPDWTREKKFSTLTQRINNSDELNRLVGIWTINYTAEQVMALMQAAGVASGMVENAQDQAEDPQLIHYKVFRELDHPYVGKVNYYHPPAFRLSDCPAELGRPVLLGEHTEFVCTQILGLSDEEFIQLSQEGVFE